ncbi:TOBE domain-containing protein [Paraburkholderia acidiphila]|uniref:Transporter n=1 Tax=Paraburkholderia acidiphila TaxID=2571747 RepID=A0A7Z2G926_9BURK|nr:TOBE domain-containing protein [Paraburkholderia acidiphila]QGZ57447.1 transporter [Paraburkholderia acidiphila]
MDTPTPRIRNQFHGRIVGIIRGEAHSEVDVSTAAGIFTSVIETRILDQLGLDAGAMVIAIVKSADVRLAMP